MADLSKFQRSKDKITEMLNYLMEDTFEDEKTNSFINSLEMSIKIIDNKMEDFKRNDLIN